VVVPTELALASCEPDCFFGLGFLVMIDVFMPLDSHLLLCPDLSTSSADEAATFPVLTSHVHSDTNKHWPLASYCTGNTLN
jgi:hypothetical protein